MAWGKRATDDLARIADALEKQNEIMRLFLECQDHHFKEWVNRKFGASDIAQGEVDMRGAVYSNEKSKP